MEMERDRYFEILNKLNQEENLEAPEIAFLLACDDQEVTKQLFSLADQKRQYYVGNEVHLRGLIEFSNVCRKNCFYCGLRRDNRRLKRYRMNEEEIYEVGKQIVHLGIKTVVLQSGEDLFYDAKAIARLVKRLKKLDIAV
ncbi:MAG: radical SAM protein, partial [Atribacterota bacterium]|nr:radical SAM protein [Atribacterota bacterium]